MSDVVHALTVFDDGRGPALYAGGTFATAGGVAVNGIAKWNGAGWAPVGSGVKALALAVFDDGAGSALYAGGSVFSPAGGIAKWDGVQWSPVGGGMNNHVHALAVFDDGSGRALYAGGPFSTAGGASASRIAKWNGTQWSPLGSGIGGPEASIHSLAAFDDGTSMGLYAGGIFSAAGAMTASKIAKWDGAQWSPLGSGIDGLDYQAVSSLTVFDDGSGGGPALHAGGSFSLVSDSGDSFLARWGCPGSITAVPGCTGNPATLVALSSLATIGQPLPLQTQASAVAAGLAFLFAGLDGTDAGGCGFLLPGSVELLLSPAPPPVLLAQQPTTVGLADFSPAIPANPSLIGVTVLLQAVHAGPLPGRIEASTGLSVTFLP